MTRNPRLYIPSLRVLPFDQFVVYSLMMVPVVDVRTRRGANEEDDSVFGTKQTRYYVLELQSFSRRIKKMMDPRMMSWKKSQEL